MIYIILAAVIWGCSFPVITYALKDISPLLFVCLRFSLSFILFLPFAKKLKNLGTIFHLDMFLCGLLAALAYILQFKAQELTTASKTSILVNINPLFIALISFIFLKSKLKLPQIIALIVGLTGVVLTGTNLEFSDFQKVNMGDIFNILVSLFWSIFIILSKDRVEKYGEVNFSLAVYFWIFLITLPFLPTENIRFSVNAIPAILFLSVAATIAAFYFYSKGIRTVSPFSTSIIFLIEIIVASGISYFFLDERFTYLEVVGSIMIMGGIVTVLRNEK